MKRLLIPIAALASIATQQATGWDDNVQLDIGAFALDQQLPSVRYAIHSELYGAGPSDAGFESRMHVNVYVSPAPSLPVTYEVRGLTHPEQTASGTAEIFDSHTGGGTTIISTFLECTTDPCAEDFELVINIDPAETRALTISGYIIVHAEGSAEMTPPGTDVIATLTGPL